MSYPWPCPTLRDVPYLGADLLPSRLEALAAAGLGVNHLTSPSWRTSLKTSRVLLIGSEF